MRLLSLEIPDATSDIPGWLEEQLVLGDLPELVAELAAVHGAQPSPVPSLDRALDGGLPEVLEHGLKSLSGKSIRTLLTNPQLLFSLQAQVCLNGGKFWLEYGQNASSSSGLGPAPRFDQLKEIMQTIRTIDADCTPPTSLASKPDRLRSVVRACMVAAALAACAGLGIWMTQPDANQIAKGPDVPSNGSADPGASPDMPNALPQVDPANTPQVNTIADARDTWLTIGLEGERSAADHLTRLADAVGPWDETAPVDAAEFQSRVAELRKGCDRLIDYAHPQLDDATRSTLIEKCKNWNDKFLAAATSVENGEATVDSAFAAISESVGKAKAALRKLADEATT